MATHLGWIPACAGMTENNAGMTENNGRMTENSMLKEIVLTFLPWIVYFVLAGPADGQMRLAIIVAVTLALLTESAGLKKKFILSYVTIFFFIFMFVAVILFNNAWILTHAWILSNAALALVAWGSLLLKRPFTIQYAKERVPEEKWTHPIFFRVNYILTMTWGLIFLFCMGVNIVKLYFPMWPHWVYESLSDGASIFGIWFSVWFPARYKKPIT